MIDVSKTPPISWRACAIPKKSGGVRHLLIPNNELKAVQKEVLQELYRHPELRSGVHAHGFIPYRNIMTGATMHKLDSPCIINIDIHNFFPSFPVEKIKEQLMLSKLMPSEIAYIMKYCVFTGKKGKSQCPQGAPTSPMLTNIGMRPLDKALSTIADKYGYTYSRYADDITLAANPEDPSYIDAPKKNHIIKTVEALLDTYGLKISWKKLSVAHRYSRKVPRRVTGVGMRQDGMGYNAKPQTRHKARCLTHILWRKLQDGEPKESLVGLYQQMMGTIKFCDYVRSFSEEGFNDADPKIDAEKFNYIQETFNG